MIVTKKKTLKFYNDHFRISNKADTDRLREFFRCVCVDFQNIVFCWMMSGSEAGAPISGCPGRCTGVCGRADPAPTGHAVLHTATCRTGCGRPGEENLPGAH